MLTSQLLEQCLAARTQMHDYLPAIEVVCGAHDQAPALGAINQLDRAVMRKLQSLRKAPDLGRLTRRKAANGQQELILLRMKVGAPRCLLTEAQKAAYLIAKFCLRDELGVERTDFVADFMSCHDIIVNIPSLLGQKRLVRHHNFQTTARFITGWLPAKLSIYNAEFAHTAVARDVSESTAEPEEKRR